MPLSRRHFLTRVAQMLPMAALSPSILKAANSQPASKIASSAILDIETAGGMTAYMYLPLNRLVNCNYRPLSRKVIDQIICDWWGRDCKLMPPLVVTPIKGTDCYQVQDGAHRLEALRRLCQTDFQCVVHYKWSEDWRDVSRFMPQNRASRRGEHIG